MDFFSGKLILLLCLMGVMGWIMPEISHGSPRLYGATRAEGSAPGLTAIYVSGKSVSQGFVATGILVHSRYVLTAAHSVEGYQPDDLVCAVGASALSEADALGLRVVDIIRHPDYGKAGAKPWYRADVALLRLGVPAAGVTPVRPYPVGEDLLTEGQEAVVMGWAGDAEGSSRRDYLLELTMPVVSLETANAAAAYGGSVEASMVPLGTPEMKLDICLESSSAPVLARRGEEPFLLGFTGFGDGCRKKNKYHIGTDLRYYIPWLETFLGTLGHGFGLPSDYRVVEVARRFQVENVIELKYSGGTPGSYPVAEISDDLLEWRRLGAEEVQVTSEGETMIWSARAPSSEGSSRFFRFAGIGSGDGETYPRVPKPMVNEMRLSGEILGEDDGIEGGGYAREYLLTRLPEGALMVRVGSETLALQAELLEPATGALLELRQGQPGTPAVLAVEGGREYLLRLWSETTTEDARFHVAITPVAQATLTPDSHEVTAQLGSESIPLEMRLGNEGGGVLDFRVSADQPWIVIDKEMGTVESRKSVTVKVVLDMGQVSATGVHLGEVRFEWAHGGPSLTASLRLTVAPAGQRLGVGQQYVGQLDATDEWSSYRAELRMDRYLFTAPTPGRYLFSMGSNVIDPYLYLLSSAGEYITESDDRGLGALYNAGISYQMAAGDTVVLEATCFGAWGRFRTVGPYQVVAVRLSD